MSGEPPAEFPSHVEAAALRYRARGRFAEGMARGKMKGDPAFRRVLEMLRNWPGERLRVLDVGCGEGYLLALLRSARPEIALIGLDHDAGRLGVGQDALADEEAIDWMAGDLRTAELPTVDLVVCLDVLHYLPPDQQDAALTRLAGALRPGGALLIRDGEAGAGWRSTLTACSERLLVALGRHQGIGVHLRTREELCAALSACGLEPQAEPCRDGTPFANVLYVARQAPAA